MLIERDLCNLCFIKVLVNPGQQNWLLLSFAYDKLLGYFFIEAVWAWIAK
jgi:hypothetical protein